MKPKKSLGQNFLTSGKAIFEIVRGGEINKGENILEIGPGKGALTEKILEAGGKVLAIEADKELIPLLENKFKKEIENENLKIIKGDILNINIEKYYKKEDSYKIIANIPYYITGAIIEKFLSVAKKPIKMVLLVQKEVAERIVARDKKESILSLAIKLYGNPKIIYKVGAGSFYPKPKVDSAVLSISINKPNLSSQKEKEYFNIIKSAFSHKRKVMLNNLKEKYKDKNLESIFTKLNIDKKARAEDLERDTFLKIVDLI